MESETSAAGTSRLTTVTERQLGGEPERFQSGPSSISLSSSSSSLSSSFFYALSSPTSCAPSYTSLPLANEETVQYTPRHGPSGVTASSTGTRGTYTKKWKKMILTLFGQPLHDVQNPIYDRHGLVVGELEMKYPERVLAVLVKLEGKVTISVAGVGARVMQTVEEQPVILWEKEGGTSRSCPGSLSFSLRLPSSFLDENGKSWKIPPSFEPNFINVHTMFVRSTYTLSISLTRVVKCPVMSWVKDKTYNVLLEHRPRNRPSRPNPRFDSIPVLASVKSLPDEWVQLVSSMEVMPGTGMKPVECHFFVPSNSMYCLSEAIPFHVQISSPLGTIRELFPPASQLLEPWQTEDTERKAAKGGWRMEVYIAREIMVEIRGRKGIRTVSIGTGILRPVPPTDLGRGRRSAPEDVCLDWEGEIKCRKEVTSGGFDVGCLNVKDYIVFALSPLCNRKRRFVGVQIAHPVKFVTDPWLENGMVHPQDYEVRR